MLLAIVERLVTHLDRARRLWFSWILRSAFVRATLTNRDRRIATLACLSVTLAALGATYLPVLLFTLGPVLLGVAHVAADIRYLVLRRRLARWWQNVALSGCVVLFATRALEALGVLDRVEHLELGLAAAFIAVALFAGVNESGAHGRAGLGLALLAAAATLAWQHPSAARLVFLHLHNVVALLAWVALFRLRKRWLLGPLALVAVAVVLLASGALSQQTLRSPFVASFHLHLLAVADIVAPFPSLRAAVGVTTAYVFLQSVHYSAWLSFIPQEELPGRGTPTFRMSVHSLFRDLGASGVAATALVALLVLGAACFELQRTRALFLSLATFHGYFELALLSYFWTRGTSRNAVRAPLATV